MLELVFVIVVIGIISAMVIPRIDRDNMFEATNQLLNHIKYTQHLAMTEDIYDDGNALWFNQRWQVQLNVCGSYTVFSDRDGVAGANRADAAFDPETKNKRLFGDPACVAPANTADYENLNLNNNYNIINIATAGCGGNNIAFDTLGRPYIGTANINGVLQVPCQIVLTDGANAETILIQPETGYACMLDAAGINCI